MRVIWDHKEWAQKQGESNMEKIKRKEERET
jgi:hypothetical protein